MANFISNLRSKPENIRIKILWISVIACMLVIVGIWFIDFKGKIFQGSADASLKRAVNNLLEDTNSINEKSSMQASLDNAINKAASSESQVEIKSEEDSKTENGQAYQLPLE